MITESKEKGSDLETNVGPGLKDYVISLSSYIPSVEKDLYTSSHKENTLYTIIKDLIINSIRNDNSKVNIFTID